MRPGVGFAGLLLCFLAGCDHPVEEAASRWDSAGVTIVESHRPRWRDSAAAWTAGSPAVSIPQGDSDLFRVADAALLPSGDIAIANKGTAEVLIYGPDGHLTRRMGSRGRGPGEFPAGPSWLQVVSPDTLLAVDREGLRAVWFSLETGDPVKTAAVPGEIHVIVGPDARLRDGRWVHFGDVPDLEGTEEGHGRSRAIAVASADGGVDTLLVTEGPEVVRRRVTFRGQQIVLNVPLPHGPTLEFAAAADRVALGNGVGDIFVRAAGESLVLRRARTPVAVTSRDVETWVDFQVRNVADEVSRNQRRRQFDGIPVPEHMPWYSDLLFDSDRNLWVRHYRFPPTADPATWSVFDPDGVWLGDVRTVADEVLGIGPDYLLTLHRDALDRETVHLYGLTK